MGKLLTPYKLKKGEKYMSEGQLKYFMNALTDWKLSLTEQEIEAKEHLQEDTERFPDASDRASHEEEFNLMLKSSDRERKLVRKIELAIEKVKNNAYGYCNVCEAAIGVNRLSARPIAELCIECKEFEEQKEKRNYK